MIGRHITKILFAEFLALTIPVVTVMGGSSMYEMVTIREALVGRSADHLNQEIDPDSKSFLQASLKCAQNDWCLAFCKKSNGDFTLTNMVLNLYVQDPYGPTMPCFTNRRQHTIFPGPGTDLTSSPHVAHFESQALTNGIYRRHRGECFRSEQVSFPFVLIELPVISLISSVTIRMQPYGPFFNEFENVDIRVGNHTAPSANFSTEYELIAQYTGPLTKQDIDREIIFSFLPVLAKFVSIQKMDENNTTFGFCTIEIE